MNNQEIFESAFQDLKVRYENIFDSFYPAYKSTGFTERNLSNNFASSLEKNWGTKTLAWFEMPTGTEKKGHIDAMAWNNEQEAMVLIEAKRFSNPDQKMVSLLKDLGRMATKSCFGDIKINDAFDKYIVLLADVWTENKPKHRIFDSWKKGFIEEEAKRLSSVEQHEINAHPSSIVGEYYWKHRFNKPENYGVLMYVANVRF